MKYKLQHYIEDKEFVGQVLDILTRHAIERFPDRPYNPDTARILGLWKMEVLRLIVMTDDNDKVVGYQGWVAAPPLTDKLLKQATLTYIYIDPAYRATDNLFSEFVQYALSALKILGTTRIFVSIDGDQKWLKEPFNNLGFTELHTVTLEYKE